MWQSQLGLPHMNKVYHIERGWAGQTWMWCSQRVSLTFSLPPIFKKQKRRFFGIFLPDAGWGWLV